MDVDVCHYSKNPLRIGGQWEHTAGHCKNGIMVCSHEWVEGVIDYYHFTGDERGLETAISIGDNILRLLDTPMYAKPGEANARETGWALRAPVSYTHLDVYKRQQISCKAPYTQVRIYSAYFPQQWKESLLVAVFKWFTS